MWQRRSAKLLTARRLHRMITQVHSRPGIDGTVQAVTEAVVSTAGFRVAALNVMRANGELETVAVAGSDDARAGLLGKRTPLSSYLEEFAVAEPWGNLLFVPHQNLPGAADRGWLPTDADLARRPRFTRRRRWHRLDALYAPLLSPAGELVGVLSVDLPQDGIWPTYQQQELLEILAVQAGIAVDSARLTEELRSREELFRWAFDRAAAGMAMIDLDDRAETNHLRVNPAFCRIVGRTEDEVLAVGVTALTHEQDRAEDERLMQQLRTGEADHYQRDKRYLTGDGGLVWVSMHVARISSPDQSFRYAVAQVEDITERRALHERLHYQADHDALTGLPNRAALLAGLVAAIDTATGTGRAGALLFVDLDGFKAVNDRYGHAKGDQVLAEVAGRLSSSVRPTDLVGRLGGDEFLVIAADLEPTGRTELAQRLERAVAAPFPGDPLITLGASIGHVPIPAGPAEPAELIAAADRAMYQVKAERG